MSECVARIVDSGVYVTCCRYCCCGCLDGGVLSGQHCFHSKLVGGNHGSFMFELVGVRLQSFDVLFCYDAGWLMCMRLVFAWQCVHLFFFQCFI